MTRINLVKVQTLSDQHLLAEYRELPRIISDWRKRGYFPKFYEGIPSNYRLGSGHVKFFRNKLKFLIKRFSLIIQELLKYDNDLLKVDHKIDRLCDKRNRLLKDREKFIIENKLYVKDLKVYNNRYLESITVVYSNGNTENISSYDYDVIKVEKNRLYASGYKEGTIKWDSSKKSYVLKLYGTSRCIPIIGFFDIISCEIK